MTTSETRAKARAFLSKAEEYLASAEQDAVAERHTAAASSAIHAGISAKDAIVTALTGQTTKGQSHSTAAKELGTALGQRPEAKNAERALRDLLAVKTDVQYSYTSITAPKAQDYLRRARTLVVLAIHIVRIGQ